MNDDGEIVNAAARVVMYPRRYGLSGKSGMHILSMLMQGPDLHEWLLYQETPLMKALHEALVKADAMGDLPDYVQVRVTD